MTRNIYATLAVLALLASGSANATVIQNWGSITAPDFVALGNWFGNTGTFSDEYVFTLTNAANSFGGVVELDPLSALNIDVTSVSLLSGGSLLGTDNSPLMFSFLGLTPGSYSFVVNGTVTSGQGLPFPVGYGGSIAFLGASVAVSEPSTLALAGFGLLALAFAMRRRLLN